MLLLCCKAHISSQFTCPLRSLRFYLTMSSVCQFASACDSTSLKRKVEPVCLSPSVKQRLEYLPTLLSLKRSIEPDTLAPCVKHQRLESTDPPQVPSWEVARKVVRQLEVVFKGMGLPYASCSHTCPCCNVSWSENTNGRYMMSPDTFCGHSACGKCYHSYLTATGKLRGSCMICDN